MFEKGPEEIVKQKACGGGGGDPAQELQYMRFAKIERNSAKQFLINYFF